MMVGYEDAGEDGEEEEGGKLMAWRKAEMDVLAVVVVEVVEM
jgi:hypothetical protein